MFFSAYLDSLPKIPENLIKEQTDSILQYRAAPQRQMKDGTTVDNVDCQRFEVTSDLSRWISNEIGIIDQVGYQITKPQKNTTTHLVHTDSHPRRWVINYILDLGGDDVYTNFYKEKNQPLLRDTLTRPDCVENLELIHTIKFKPHRWFILNARILHDVINIKSDRIYITLGIDNVEPFSNLYKYKDIISQ